LKIQQVAAQFSGYFPLFSGKAAGKKWKTECLAREPS